MTEPMHADRVAQIEGCERNSRPGPWTLADANDGDGTPPFWVVTSPGNEGGEWSVAIHVGDKAVGEFIAMARTAVPELLGEVARLEVAADRKNRLLRRLEEQRDEQRARADRLAKELADLRPYAEAGKALAAKQAESEYYHGTCDGCSCCTTAQCR